MYMCIYMYMYVQTCLHSIMLVQHNYIMVCIVLYYCMYVQTCLHNIMLVQYNYIMVE